MCLVVARVVRANDVHSDRGEQMSRGSSEAVPPKRASLIVLNFRDDGPGRKDLH